MNEPSKTTKRSEPKNPPAKGAPFRVRTGLRAGDGVPKLDGSSKDGGY